MSSPRVISWLPINNTLIANSQSTTAAGNLVLNSSVPGQPQGSFIYDKVIRKIRLTTTGDESGTNYTITGIGSPVDGNGNPIQPVSLISEGPFAGPTNGNPVDSNYIYQQIVSISTDAAVGNISVGSGPSGITDFVFLDYNKVFGFAACSIQFLNQTTITATGYNSLNKPQTVNINTGNLNILPFAPNSGLTFKVACLVVQATNLTATYNNGAAGVGATLTNSGALAALVVDGVTVPLNARVLVIGQATTYQNGIYTLTTSGTAWVLTRATDYNTPAQIQSGNMVPVSSGIQYGGSYWLQTSSVTTIGTDPITFLQFTSFFANDFITSTSANTFKQIPTPSSVVWLSVSNTTTDLLNFTVLQQGVFP